MDKTYVLNQPYLKKLHKLLIERFNEPELKELCFYLPVDYESLNGDGKADKARELIQHCQRHGLLKKLMTEINKQRPYILQNPSSGLSELQSVTVTIENIIFNIYL